MPKWKVALRILCPTVVIVLLILAALVYIPRTETLDYDMTGYIIQSDGEVIERFNFTITGKEYDFIIDGLKSGRLSFSGDKLTEIGMDAFVMYFDWDSATFSEKYTFGHYVGDYHPENARFVIGELNYYNGAANDSYFETGMLDLENSTFCMYADNLVEDAFIVGVSDLNTDPLTVMECYRKLVKVPE